MAIILPTGFTTGMTAQSKEAWLQTLSKGCTTGTTPHSKEAWLSTLYYRIHHKNDSTQQGSMAINFFL